MTTQRTLLKKYIAPLFLASLLFTQSVSADELKDISKLAEQGKQEAALERINTFLEANPNDAQGMFMKGIILAESGKRAEAISTFNSLTKKYPTLPEPYNNLAVLHAEAGEYDLAKKALETAIKTHPSYATAHENLGDIYARMASEAYDKALKLDNGNSRAQNKLALIKDLFSSSKRTQIAANTETPTRPIRPADKKVMPAPAPEPTPAPAPAPAPEPTPAPKPVVKAPEPVQPEPEQKPEPTPSIASEDDVIAAVDAWVDAWSSQDVDKYLASYASTFIPKGGQSRMTWEKTRRARVSAPSKISLELKDREVKMIDDENAEVSFRQHYQGDGRPFRTDKTLVLKKENGQWLIDRELNN